MSPVIAFFGGVLSFLSPCVLPIVPAYLSLVAGSNLQELSATSPLKAAARTLPGALAFVGGFTLIFTILGAAATATFTLFGQARVAVEVGAGLLLTILGIHLIGFIRIPLLERHLSFEAPATTDQSSPVKRLALAFVVGITFGAAWVPCIGPILAAILTLAAQLSSPLDGAFLLTFYALGLGLPFLLAALGVRVFLRTMQSIRPHMRTIEICAGWLILITGILTASGNMSRLANLLARWFPDWLNFG